jgi:hypothetical protein
MKKLFCPKCNCFKDNFVYANKYNSSKFCSDCGTYLGMKEFEEPYVTEHPYVFISEALYNAFKKL